MKLKNLFLITFLLFFLGFIFYSSNYNNFNHLKKIKINNAIIFVEVVDRPTEREKGLSGRDFLPENQGMLFVFEKPDYWSFWMKGMKFPLDFVWIKDNQIVEITENVKPEDFQPPKVLQPKIPSDKVLEVNGGMVKSWGIKVGDTISL